MYRKGRVFYLFSGMGQSTDKYIYIDILLSIKNIFYSILHTNTYIPTNTHTYLPTHTPMHTPNTHTHTCTHTHTHTVSWVSSQALHWFISWRIPDLAASVSFSTTWLMLKLRHVGFYNIIKTYNILQPVGKTSHSLTIK